MINILIAPDTEHRIADRARREGRAEADLIRSLIEDGLDELDDLEMALTRLGSPMQPQTSAQARKTPGLDD